MAARTSEKTKAQIIEMRANNHLIDEIVEKCGVSRSTVHRILRNSNGNGRPHTQREKYKAIDPPKVGVSPVTELAIKQRLRKRGVHLV